MLQRMVRFSGFVAMSSLISVAILASAAHFDVAQAQKVRAAVVTCGKELQKKCTGVPVSGNNMFECLKNDQHTLSERCAALAENIVHRCDRDAAQRCQGNVAGDGNILKCLTAASRSVSARCNAALNAVYLRH